MKKLTVIFSFLFFLSAHAQQQVTLSPEVQIRIATQAAPSEFREHSKVYGFDDQGNFVVLREGTNGYICLAPDPKMKTYYAYCYPESLEPFMARGRELIAEGRRKERDQIREEEFKSGKLFIPTQPSTLYGYWGSADKLDSSTGEMSDAKRRYVIYIPYAKAEDLGLSNKPNNLGIPWLMGEGTYKAHIMITPPMDHSH